MLSLLGGVFLGWSLGANDAANTFGSAVSSRMVKFWTAAILAAAFILIGALLEGGSGIETLTGLTNLNLKQAVVSSVAAAVTVTMMTLLGLNFTSSGRCHSRDRVSQSRIKCGRTRQGGCLLVRNADRRDTGGSCSV